MILICYTTICPCALRGDPPPTPPVPVATHAQPFRYTQSRSYSSITVTLPHAPIPESLFVELNNANTMWGQEYQVSGNDLTITFNAIRNINAGDLPDEFLIRYQYLV